MSQLTDFYLNNGKDNKDRVLVAIHLWDDSKLEYSHDYIQWLFPTAQPSRFNPDAPLLTKEDVDILIDSPIFIKNFVKSFFVFFEFLQRGTQKSSVQYWLGPFNHNQLRISRVIDSCILLGQKGLAHLLYEYATSQNHNGGLDKAKVYWEEILS